MNTTQFQQWLNAQGASLVVDGQIGPATETSTLKIFSNASAPAVNAADIAGFASALGCSVKQIEAVAKVESAGSGFDDLGRPKILFERHYFHRLTKGRFGLSDISNPKWGGYGKSSAQWGRLMKAVALDPGAAFASCSWGAFQVMGGHWEKLGYAGPVQMAWTFAQSEADHYESLVRYIRAFGLVDELRALSTNADDNRGFAKGYNGPAYSEHNPPYDVRLARAMA